MGQQMQTLTYYGDDSTKLQLDIFLPENDVLDAKRPVFLFVHGGGFASGDRASGHTISKYLATKGFVTASITYRLYMIDQSFSCDGVLSEKIKAIQYAANHIWLATKFLLDHSARYQIDASHFFLGGSSAGAEAILHAAYWDRSVMNWYPNKLDPDFKYSGLVSGAGAIMDLNMIREENALPSFFFHGNKDQLVPYATASHHYCPPNAPGWLMFFGSHSIHQHLVDIGKSSTLITYDKSGHEKAGILFYEEMHRIHQFLVDVHSGKTIQKHETIK